MEMLKDFPEDYEWFCMIKDSIQISGETILNNRKKKLVTELIDLKCLGCGSKGHLIKYCPYSHFSIDQEAVILKYNYSNE
jgi:6-phosphogluconolactonase/glucosamine-6-phosphate isomerase/deaminase